ncbi:PUB domain-containing protein [Haematococcus lacustris]|uniref:PUB domain-containing protein n=1 Tax=Haematococcus lacustris TaxID=44745 RepID=A0A699YWD4_HAELA|nr:PUB domain-containing protein [Haematococcus lacustris]
MANLAAAAERILASAPVITPADPVVVEGKKRFSLALESELLDYKHNHPVHIENCAALLIKIFGNVLDHPDEAKYRQIKASGNTFKTQVANVKGGEHLMTLAGWKVQVCPCP